jgi:transmembrane sensor
MKRSEPRSIGSGTVIMHADEIADRDPVTEGAIAWRPSAASDDMDWDAFTLWLEASPEHRARYTEVALADAQLVAQRDAVRRALTAAEPKTVRRPPLNRAVWGIGAAAAAVLVAVMALPLLLRESEVVYASDAGTKTISFADGSQATLAPHSRLLLKGAGMRDMRLEGGAWFAIRHDPERALKITAGPVVVRDIGTSFDVQVDGALARVNVTDGQVSVSSTALERPLTLQHGKGLLYDSVAGRAEVQDVDPATAGSWRSGELRYQRTPLSLVALDLNRYAGIHLSVPPELRGRRFSGILTVKDAEATKRDLAQLMGLMLVRGPGGDRLSASRH